MSSKTIYMFRHGETDWNVAQRFQGQTPHVPLNNNGLAQARDLAQRMRETNVDLIYSSPLMRARQTAEIVAESCPAKIVFDDELQERRYGKLEGLTKPEVMALFPELAVGLASTRFSDFVSPDGNNYETESIAEMQERMHNAVVRLAENTAQERFAVSTHGSVALNFLARIEGRYDLPMLRNCELLVFSYDPAQRSFSLRERG